MSAHARIAFVTKTDNSYTRHLAMGLSRFAKPAHGFALREFILQKGARELPSSFNAWHPDGIVSFISSDDLDLLAALSAGGRFVVNASRMQPRPGIGVVLGNAEEAYQLIHSHFQRLGISSVAQFVLDNDAGSLASRDIYRQYCHARQIPFHSFIAVKKKSGVEIDLNDVAGMNQPIAAMADWLNSLPCPTGVFSMQNYGGNYLCRTCELLGIEIPNKIAVIGADDFDVATAANPPVTSFQISGVAVGYEAGKMLADMLNGGEAPQDIVIVNGVQLIERESTRHTALQGFDLDAAMAFISNYACQGIRVNDVVAHTQGASRMTFHTRFAKATGMTPGEAIRLHQLKEARRLLADTELSTGAIAAMCGFNDYVYFYRIFKEAEGISPRAYRRLVALQR